MLRPRQPAADRPDRRRRPRLRGGDPERRRRRPLRGLPARAETPSGAGIIVLPDVRGLHPYYEELALRFAEAGVDALAIDYFGRTAGIGIRERPTDFDFMAHVGETRYANLSWDVQVAAEMLRGLAPAGSTVGTQPRASAGARATRGAACGRSSRSASASAAGWPSSPTRSAWTSPGRSASTAGRSAARSDIPAPADSTGLMTGPVLGIFGGADRGIPPEAVETFRDALAATGVATTWSPTRRRPHSFFDRKAEDFADVSDAWSGCWRSSDEHAA